MRWSLNEIVIESSRVECELCSGETDRVMEQIVNNRGDHRNSVVG